MNVVPFCFIVLANGVPDLEPPGGRPVEPTALIAGRISPEKGTATALRAAAEVGLRPVLAGAVFDREYWERWIHQEQIRRAVGNLLNTAVEATEAGEVRVTARRAPHRVVIEVADPGRGVPDSDKERLFLPYFSTKGRGTGLGLAIVHRIVNDHDGRISVHDNYPRGTRFEIELPA